MIYIPWLATLQIQFSLVLFHMRELKIQWWDFAILTNNPVQIAVLHYKSVCEKRHAKIDDTMEFKATKSINHWGDLTRECVWQWLILMKIFFLWW